MIHGCSSAPNWRHGSCNPWPRLLSRRIPQAAPRLQAAHRRHLPPLLLQPPLRLALLLPGHGVASRGTGAQVGGGLAGGAAPLWKGEKMAYARRALIWFLDLFRRESNMLVWRIGGLPLVACIDCYACKAVCKPFINAP